MRRIVGALAIAGALAVWEIAARTGVWNPIYFLPPSAIAPTFGDLFMDGTLLRESQHTLARIGIGFAISVPLGVGMGLLCGTVRVLEWAVTPVVELIRSVPPLALLPVFLLFFGIGLRFPVAIIVWVAWVPIFLNVLAGVHHVERALIEAAQNMGATQWQVTRHVLIPYTVPYLLVGLRLAMGAAFLVVVAAEMIGTPTGLGYYILDTSQTFRIPEMYAAIVAMGMLAFLANALIIAVSWLLWPYQGDLV